MVPDLLMLQTRIKNPLIRRGIVALALLAVLLGIPVAAAQTFDEAVGAVIRRDYATAIRGFRVHAEQGHAEAQLILGGMYADGRGVLKDDAEAVRWFRLAADQGLAGAQLELGFMYADGRGVLKDDAEAVRWFRARCGSGSRRCAARTRVQVRQRAGRSQGRGRSRALGSLRIRVTLAADQGLAMRSRALVPARCGSG